MRKISIFNEVKSYFLITLGLAIAAFGWAGFIIPSKILGGGVTGISTILFYATKFEVGYSVLIINSLLVIVAIKMLGPRFGISTVYGTLVFAFALILMQKFITKPITTDRFMSAIVGGGLSGFGTALAFMNGGNGGGLDIVALVVAKLKNISPGRVNFYTNLLIIASSYLVTKNWETVVYGYIVMGVSSYMLDLTLDGAKQSYQVTIISKKSNEIADLLIGDLRRGVTVVRGIGWFTKTETDMIIVIIHKNDMQTLHRILVNTDKEAFISEAKVAAVFGKNFAEIKA